MKGLGDEGDDTVAHGTAPPKSTGGGGYVFEDKVSAWFLAHMLTGVPPLGVDFGQLESVSFQTKVDGWYLDDLLLSFDGGRRYAISVKSSDQFEHARAPADFVSAIWNQWLGGSPFDAETDYMGLASAPQQPDVRRALASLVRKATAGEGLGDRYTKKGWASVEERSLFSSLSCPQELAVTHDVTEKNTSDLLRHLKFREFDFEDDPSRSETEAVECCRSALTCRELSQGRKLWDRLLRISAELRPHAGKVAYTELLARLRTEFDLAGFPDLEPDWLRLRKLTLTNVGQVPDSIGQKVRLSRQEDIAGIESQIAEKPVVVLVGPSGVGKSTTAKQWAEQLLSHREICLWFNANSFDGRDFAAFEAALRLNNSLDKLLRSVPNPRSVLIVDGLDRLYDDNAFRTLASLLRALELDQRDTPWRVLLTCQTQEWRRLRDSLRKAGVQVTGLHPRECRPFAVSELTAVWQEFPHIAHLQDEVRLHPLFSNLEILDFIVGQLQETGEVPDSDLVGEASIAKWFYETKIALGPRKALRTRLSKRLAERLADSLTPSLSLEEFSDAELPFLEEELEREHICIVADGRISFRHDLLGDWVRLSILLSEQGDLEVFLRTRLDSPLWHRAVRLYGMYLLEHVGDVDKWRDIINASDSVEDALLQDLLLESVMFAANAVTLLDRIESDLMIDEGRLLQRLVKRFLLTATVPAPIVEQSASAVLAAQYRKPDVHYWPPVIQFLYKHRRRVVDFAPVRAAEVVQLWLENSPSGAPLRLESAELGLMLGEKALEELSLQVVDRTGFIRSLFVAAITAATELPDAAAAFALKASKRTADSSALEASPPAFPRLTSYSSQGQHNPWDYAPFGEVEPRFREVALDTVGLLPLIKARPAVAREVVLASLIERPQASEVWRRGPIESLHLDLHRLPGMGGYFYLDGPFLGFLRVNFDEGLMLIEQLVYFATWRWSQCFAKRAQESKGARDDRGMQDEQPSCECLVVELPEENRRFLGNGHVYGWAAGLGNPPPPPAVLTALMALEQYLYMEMNEGRPVDAKVRLVLERCRSVALLQVLCDVGKRQPELFEGPLRPLLAIPEIYFWDISASVHGRAHLMLGVVMRPEFVIEMAKAFHELPHRTLVLRDVATELFLNRQAVRDSLEKARSSWEQTLEVLPDGRFRQFLESLVIRFTAENYVRMKHPEHGWVLVNQRVWELYNAQAEGRKALERTRWILELLNFCQDRIARGAGLPGGNIDSFWNDIQTAASTVQQAFSQTKTQHRNGGPSVLDRRQTQSTAGRVFHLLLRRGVRAVCSRTTPRNVVSEEESVSKQPAIEYGPSDLPCDVAFDAVMAGVALLLCLHRDWLEQHPERKKWCLDVLQAVVLGRPQHALLDSPEGVTSWVWKFAAEALPSLWVEQPHNRELRILAAHLVFAPDYEAVGTLFNRCAESRALLGTNFDRLRQLLLERAKLLDLVNFLERRRYTLGDRHVARIRKRIARWACRRVSLFTRGRSFGSCSSWREVPSPPHVRSIRKALKRWQRYAYLDLELVRVAHNWLPAPDEALNERERQNILEFWREALGYVLARARTDDGLPHPNEKWILQGVASAIQYMNPDESPEDMWEPIADLPSNADRWVAEFLQAFHRYGLTCEPTPVGYAPLARKIIERVIQSHEESKDQSGWLRHYDVAEALLGLDRYTQKLWDTRHRILVGERSDLFKKWTETVPPYGYCIATFSNWLKGQAAEPIRLAALVWLQRWLNRGQEYYLLDRGGGEDAVAALLDQVWVQEESRLRDDANALEAFRWMLRYLAGRQNRTACELSRRIGGLV